jgi:hypothetical protein
MTVKIVCLDTSNTSCVTSSKICWQHRRSKHR